MLKMCGIYNRKKRTRDLADTHTDTQTNRMIEYIWTLQTDTQDRGKDRQID